MTNPGVIPIPQADSVWQNLNNIGSLKPIISEVDINKPTSFSGSASRIYGDLSNSTFSNRLLFQTYVQDSYTSLGLIPNGINDTSVFSLFNNSDPDNASNGSISIDSSAMILQAGKTGTGGYLPISINAGGSQRVQIETDGYIKIQDVNTPTALTNVLYSSGGDLFWDNSKINSEQGVTQSYVDSVSGNLQLQIDTKEPILTKGVLSSTSPITIDNVRSVIGGNATISISSTPTFTNVTSNTPISGGHLTTKNYVDEEITNIKRTAIIYVIESTTNCSTGNGKAYLTIPDELNGLNLTAVHARVLTAGVSGTMTIQITNVTDSTSMLSTKLTIDSGQVGSDTSTTQAVIDLAYDDVAVNDLISINIDTIHTSVASKGLITRLTFGG